MRFSRSLFSLGYLPVGLHFNLIKEFIVLSFVHDIFGLPSRGRLLLRDYGKSNLSLIPADLFYRRFEPGSEVPLDKVIRFQLALLQIHLRVSIASLLEDAADGSENDRVFEFQDSGVLYFCRQSVQ